MIGCVAKAQSYEVLLNTSEMEDVQWYDRAELAAAVRWYDKNLPLQEAQRRSWATLGEWRTGATLRAHRGLLCSAAVRAQECTCAPSPTPKFAWVSCVHCIR